jgi:ABC-type branched-subunit amino acid transport system substrate-binding protein
MKGTTPLVKLSDDFKKRVLDNWTKEGNATFADFNYTAETYDAVTIIALAAQQAKTDGIGYTKFINGITGGDGGKGTACNSFKTCNDLITAGTQPHYQGAGGDYVFSGNGEPTKASYGVLQFGSDDHIDDTKTQFVTAQAPANKAFEAQTPIDGTRAGDGTLKIATLLPQTGSLAFLGPPEFAGFDLAIADINAAGGVLGKNVETVKGDSGDATTDTASKTVDSELSQNVDAIIGAASSGVSLSVIDKITAAGVVMFSPANTSKALSTYADHGLYFRTAPSDILQGAVLAQVIQSDGNATVGIIARNDSYGSGLSADLKTDLEAAGVKVVDLKLYDEKATSFDADVDALKAENPDAIAIIGFDESSKILANMVEKGIGPKVKKVYGCDGNIGSALGDTFDAGK